MAFKLVIKPIVFDDAEEAVAYYENKWTGLGKRFYNNFLQSLDDIKANPFTYTHVTKSVRRHLIKNSPIKFITLLQMS